MKSPKEIHECIITLGNKYCPSYLSEESVCQLRAGKFSDPRCNMVSEVSNRSEIVDNFCGLILALQKQMLAMNVKMFRENVGIINHE